MRDLIVEIADVVPEKVVVNVKEDLSISNDLDHEVDTAARNFGYYAIIAEKAESRYQKCKAAFERWKAMAETNSAREREEEGLKKMTVAERENFISSQDKFRAFQIKMIQYDEDRRIMKVVSKAFEAKKDLVQTKAANRRSEHSGRVSKGSYDKERILR